MAKTVITETNTRTVNPEGNSAAEILRLVEVDSVRRHRIDADDVRDFLDALRAAGVPDDVPISAVVDNDWLTGLAAKWRTRRELPLDEVEAGSNGE